MIIYPKNKILFPSQVQFFASFFLPLSLTFSQNRHFLATSATAFSHSCITWQLNCLLFAWSKTFLKTINFFANDWKLFSVLAYMFLELAIFPMFLTFFFKTFQWEITLFIGVKLIFPVLAIYTVFKCRSKILNWYTKTNPSKPRLDPNLDQKWKPKKLFNAFCYCL